MTLEELRELKPGTIIIAHVMGRDEELEYFGNNSIACMRHLAIKAGADGERFDKFIQTLPAFSIEEEPEYYDFIGTNYGTLSISGSDEKMQQILDSFKIRVKE